VIKKNVLRLMTHPRRVDSIGDLDEELLVLLCVLASYEHFDREPAAFKLLEMLCCIASESACDLQVMNEIFFCFCIPFFAVVTM
jgi:hypothetical protein